MDIIVHVDKTTAAQCGSQATIIALDGEFASLDDVGLETLGELLAEQAAAASPPELVLDLAGTSYIGSQFIRMLLQIWKPLHQRGGRLVLCGVHDFCADVLRAMQLDQLWPCRETRRQAVEFLQQRVVV
jgi:anti-anti-sigma factor